MFCISNTNIKKPGIVNNDVSNNIKSKIETSEKTISKLDSRLNIDTELNTGYTSPMEIKYLFEKVKLSEGVRIVENGQVKKEAKPETTLYGNTAFRITKTDYNKM